MDYYKQIFKRKSFHLFRDTGVITEFAVKPIYHHGTNNMEKIHGQMNREWNGTKL